MTRDDRRLHNAGVPRVISRDPTERRAGYFPAFRKHEKFKKLRRVDANMAPDQKRFAVLVCDIQSIQLLLLGVKHIRAYYKKTTNWQGEWLSP